MESYLPFVEWGFLNESINFACEHMGRRSFFWFKERVQGEHIMLKPSSRE